jgi:hypothetical protein
MLLVTSSQYKIIFSYSFNVEDASNYGVDCAVMIKNIDFWISKIKLTETFTMGNFGLIIQNKHFFDIISVWTENQVRYIIKN